MVRGLRIAKIMWGSQNQKLLKKRHQKMSKRITENSGAVLGDAEP